MQLYDGPNKATVLTVDESEGGLRPFLGEILEVYPLEERFRNSSHIRPVSWKLGTVLRIKTPFRKVTKITAQTNGLTVGPSAGVKGSRSPQRTNMGHLGSRPGATSQGRGPGWPGRRGQVRSGESSIH